MEFDRKPTDIELALIENLINKASICYSDEWKDALLVRPLNDNGMGSLLLIPKGSNEKERSFGEKVSEVQFKDSDGVDVLASLNLDSEGSLYELDIWKVDFTPLLSLNA